MPISTPSGIHYTCTCIQRKYCVSYQVCFSCRQPGHWVGECPLNSTSAGICFKCGSSEHSCQQCHVKIPSGEIRRETMALCCGYVEWLRHWFVTLTSTGEFPYAKCFICGEVGHLSRSCSDNPRGLYPKGETEGTTLLFNFYTSIIHSHTGGGCRVCGSVEHLRANCPLHKKSSSSECNTPLSVSGCTLTVVCLQFLLTLLLVEAHVALMLLQVQMNRISLQANLPSRNSGLAEEKKRW